MESSVISDGIYGNLKRYCRRKKYQRLDGSRAGRSRSTETARMGSRRRRWKIKILPKLRFFKISSPKQILRKLRNGYVNMMLRIANSGAFIGAEPFEMRPFRPTPVKEYDEKVLIEIYKSILTQGQMVPRSSGKIAFDRCSRRK